mmetsp:Transcript_8916/g.14146  ORF Transcript_8916/g.14146 Transcript_8916/m.14146 type:complete len:89 (+) Transcript_8916:35-301(+)|eukprot:CAMPEP_0198701074 /NCGR_PEP_ID=MMETSP1468-20131203/379269_1 /TAXON_ID=1461545 /ORGANISM="Mantoniella sp, Strain CCMP1436" /LENGTH=88 /DNA_ID=CAMNT_0044459239 /DNA_START=36 /DNA_END=302 /DNA_ORIENTATION=+
MEVNDRDDAMDVHMTGICFSTHAPNEKAKDHKFLVKDGFGGRASLDVGTGLAPGFALCAACFESSTGARRALAMLLVSALHGRQNRAG